jgi:hypothetical protein
MRPRRVVDADAWARHLWRLCSPNEGARRRRRRSFDAMMTMQKIDRAKIEAASRG